MDEMNEKVHTNLSFKLEFISTVFLTHAEQAIANAGMCRPANTHVS